MDNYTLVLQIYYPEVMLIMPSCIESGKVSPMVTSSLQGLHRAILPRPCWKTEKIITE